MQSWVAIQAYSSYSSAALRGCPAAQPLYHNSPVFFPDHPDHPLCESCRHGSRISPPHAARALLATPGERERARARSATRTSSCDREARDVRTRGSRDAAVYGQCSTRRALCSSPYHRAPSRHRSGAGSGRRGQGAALLHVPSLSVLPRPPRRARARRDYARGAEVST